MASLRLDEFWISPLALAVLCAEKEHHCSGFTMLHSNEEHDVLTICQVKVSYLPFLDACWVGVQAYCTRQVVHLDALCVDAEG